MFRIEKWESDWILNTYKTVRLFILCFKDILLRVKGSRILLVLKQVLCLLMVVKEVLYKLATL